MYVNRRRRRRRRRWLSEQSHFSKKQRSTLQR